MPLRKFDLLSLVGGRKNKHEASPQPDAVSSHSHQSNRRLAPSSLHTSNASYRSSHNVFQSNSRSSYSTSDVPPPAPAPSRDGFYSSVQYQRLTSLPTINQRPPSSASSIQYERLSIPQVPVKYEPSTVSTASNTLFPSPTYEYVSQLILTAESPVQVPPPLQPTPPAPADSSILSLLSPAEESVPVRTRTSQSPRSIGNVVKDRTASREETSPPFSIVMEEWMSQLRTPTPDVTLLPSPYDFNQNTPTPVEKMEDIRHIHDALLPTPPPDMHDQKQGTKSNQYISSANRRGHPLMEDVASICRDLIPQDVADQVTKRILTSIANAQGGDPATAAAATLAVAQMSKASYNKEPMSSFRNQVNLPSPPIDGEEDEGGGGEGGGKGKRRKMCTADGCQNLSRSRGLCKAHGGGRRCSVEGCTRASQSGSLCITHGGGKRCTVHGCQKAAQSRGMCKAHGGGVRCRIDGCTKSSQGDGFCRTHGGGRRCGYPEGCTKWAQRNGMCMAHSEGRYGNSYRGRLARMQGMEGNEDDHDGEDDDEDV